MNKEEVKKWLLKGGFLFELECINAFQNIGFTVLPGVHYVDNETNVHREVDFIAAKNLKIENTKYTFNICFVVECKAHIEPIVAISALSNLSKPQIVSNLICSKNVNSIQLRIANSGGLSSFTFGLEDNEIVPETIIAYTGGSKNQKENKIDRVYQAMMQSLNASTFLRDKSNNSDAKFSNIYIPVVIFDNELHIANSKDGDINLNAVDYCKVSKLYAFDKNNLYSIFHIVSSSGLENYCNKIASEVTDFLANYKVDIEAIAKNEPNNTGKGQYAIG